MLESTATGQEVVHCATRNPAKYARVDIFVLLVRGDSSVWAGAQRTG